MFQLSPASVHRLVAGCLSLGFFATLPFTMHSQTAASPTAPTATKVAAGSFHDTDTAGYTAEDFRFTTKGNGLYQIQSRLEADGLHIQLPTQARGRYAYAFRVLLGGMAQ